MSKFKFKSSDPYYRDVQQGDLITIIEARDGKDGNAYAGWRGYVQFDNPHVFSVERGPKGASTGALVCPSVGAYSRYKPIHYEMGGKQYCHRWDEARYQDAKQEAEDNKAEWDMFWADVKGFPAMVLDFMRGLLRIDFS